MTTPLLTTKLYIPPVRPELVSRPRLIERLNAGTRSGCKLTLISAPAGYGKTTLLSEWAYQAEILVAWVSLDKDDNDPVRFLTYVITALRTIPSLSEAELGQTTLAMLRSPQPPPVESVLTPLINDITKIPQSTSLPFALILDDYHVIEAQPVDDALIFLLDHLPPQMHLIVAGRADPSLPLSRLRAGGQMTEIRVNDLRFTRDEAATFFNQAMGLNLSPDNIAALETRTEGWIAGLQLVALSMQGEHPNHIPGFIQSFTGSHRYIVDYLVEEVLKRRPPGTRAFLLETSILDRMTGSLCDAVCGASGEGTAQSDGQATLERLEEANLFLIPLDNERRWYRYHHLFAELLRNQLEATQPKLVPILHRRASAWYEENGFTYEAVSHALAAKDFEGAARLIKPIGFLIMTRSEWSTLMGWLEAMPKSFVRTRPWLCIFQAWMLRRAGRYDAVKELVRDAERGLSAADTPVTSEDAPVIRAHIASLRAYVAIYNREIPRAIELAHQALECSPAENMIRGATGLILGMASRMSGDLVAANRAFAGARSTAQEVDNVFLTHIATWDIGYTHLLQGRLHQAADTYREALELAAEQGERRILFTGPPHVYLGDIRREWNELEAAETHLLEGVDQCQPTRLLDALTDGYVALAHVRLAQGDLHAALAACRNAQQLLQVPSPDPVNVIRVGQCQIRLWLAQGDLVAAARWVREIGLSLDDEIDFKRELEHILLARVLVAQGIEQPEESYLADALHLLARLLETAETAGWMGKAIEILVLQALALQAQDNIEKALTALERALSLGESEGYVRTFVDEGAPVEVLLQIAASRGILPDYVGKLLVAFEAETGYKRPSEGTKVDVSTSVAHKSPSLSAPREAGGLIEPLSRREQEVLRLIAAGLTNRETAHELTIAVSTVKTHLKNIYAKLGVRNRTQAAARAKELDLLP